MPRQVEQLRAWGLPASNSPVVGVLARYPSVNRQRWTCILRWDTSTRKLEIGSWTTLHLKEAVCAVSPDGEYLFYSASGPLSGPFSRRFGGGVAISRLPWLAALTDIRPACVVGGGPSKHALPEGDQERLWKLFDDLPWYRRTEDWPRHFGPRWKRAAELEYPADRVPRQTANRRVRRVALAGIPRMHLSLVIIVDRARASDDQQDAPRYFLQATDSTDLGALPELRWAHPTDNGAIAAATLDGRLQLLVPKSPGDPKAGVRVKFEEDLNKLKPRPTPPPPRALARVSTTRRRAQ